MIYKKKRFCCYYDERCGGYVDYNDFRVYDKLTNTVYERLSIAAKVTGIPYDKIVSDMQHATKRWNRIGHAFVNRKYNYYACPENFVTNHKGRPKRNKEISDNGSI